MRLATRTRSFFSAVPISSSACAMGTNLGEDQFAAGRLDERIVNALGDVLGFEHFEFLLLADLLVNGFVDQVRSDQAGLDQSDFDAAAVDRFAQGLGEAANAGFG